MADLKWCSGADLAAGAGVGLGFGTGVATGAAARAVAGGGFCLAASKARDFSARCQGVGHRYDVLTELSRREKDQAIKPDPYIDFFMKVSEPSRSCSYCNSSWTWALPIGFPRCKYLESCVWRNREFLNSRTMNRSIMGE